MSECIPPCRCHMRTSKSRFTHCGLRILGTLMAALLVDKLRCGSAVRFSAPRYGQKCYACKLQLTICFASHSDERSEAVVFDLVNPVLARWRLWREHRILRRDERWHRTIRGHGRSNKDSSEQSRDPRRCLRKA